MNISVWFVKFVLFIIVVPKTEQNTSFFFSQIFGKQIWKVSASNVFTLIFWFIDLEASFSKQRLISAWVFDFCWDTAWLAIIYQDYPFLQIDLIRTETIFSHKWIFIYLWIISPWGFSTDALIYLFDDFCQWFRVFLEIFDDCIDIVFNSKPHNMLIIFYCLILWDFKFYKAYFEMKDENELYEIFYCLITWR